MRGHVRMKDSKKRRGQIALGRELPITGAMLLVFVLALIFVVVVAVTGHRVSAEVTLPDMNFADGWRLPDGTELTLPLADKEHDALTIRKTLPEGLSEQDSLVFSSGYQPVRVVVDGEALPVVGTFEGRIVYATAYSRVSLRPEWSGKEIEVTFLNRGGKQWMEIYNITLGDFNLIRQAAFAEDRIPVISGTFLLAVSLLIFILGLLQRESAVKVMNRRTQHFGLAASVTAMLAIWILVDTETVTLLFGDNPAYVFVNIFSFLFIMGPWLMQMIFTAEKHSLWLHMLAMSGLIETVVIMLGVVVGFFDFSAYLTFSHLIGAFVESAILYLSFDACRTRKDVGSKLLFAASILLVLMSCIAAYTYYFKVSPNNVSYMKYGIVGYTVVMLYDLIATFRSINRQYVSEVETARQAAVDANRAKSDFLSSMSHDIRTPMNAIMGLTTIASANIDNKDAVRDSLRKITTSSRHLLGLINDVLDMSKIESGKLSLTMAEVSLPELMENLVNIVQPQIRSRRQVFDIFLENVDCETVYCDGVRLNQVLLNLLSNAVKYTKEGGRVHVTVHQEASPKGDDRVRTSFRVSDTGIGMSADFVEHVFDSFARADNAHVHATEGTGLGMSITKHIVDMMEGSIAVDSRPGEGSTFVVTLDLVRVCAQATDDVLPPWNTLVVDDDEPLCQSAVQTLRDMGMSAEYTLRGEEAVEMVSERAQGLHPYDAVLLDWQMPTMDGLQTARRIRARVGEQVPILLITAYDWSEIEEEARAAGINGFLAKPLFRSTLRCGLMRYVGEGDTVVAAEREDAPDFSGRRILLAEDNEINCEIAHTILTSYGFVIDHAEDGLQCLQMFEQAPVGQYDLILMDIRMPRMDGYQSTEAIRALARPDASTIPILAMTADAFTEDIRHCMDVGMNGHIAKPLDVKALLRMIEGHLA